jgi:hypothetical protein
VDFLGQTYVHTCVYTYIHTFIHSLSLSLSLSLSHTHTQTHTHVTHTHICFLFLFFKFVLHQERLSATARTHESVEFEASKRPPKLNPVQSSPLAAVTSRDTSRDTSLHTVVPYEEEDTSHACHMRRAIHASVHTAVPSYEEEDTCHMRRRIHTAVPACEASSSPPLLPVPAASKETNHSVTRDLQALNVEDFGGQGPGDDHRVADPGVCVCVCACVCVCVCGRACVRIYIHILLDSVLKVVRRIFEP